MREIKFRVWHLVSKCYLTSEMTESPYRVPVIPDTLSFRLDDANVHYEQFTGLKDKNGVEIYEGDIIESHTPQRSSQTHYGDNIINGEYTEPREPVIVTSRSVVAHRDGCFTLDKDNGEMPWPIGYGPEFVSYDLEGAKEGFEGNWATYSNGQFVWIDPDDPEDGDLPYLLEEYKLADEAALVAYLGMEVAGNIHENPELLK